MTLPEMVRVRQEFKTEREQDVAQAVHRELARLELEQRIRPGQSVAVTAGSRGIANIPTIIQAVVEHLRKLKADPFIVPAMGSHGEATAQGQIEVLASYGITEQSVGAPIRSSMEVVQVGTNPAGTPVYTDRHAASADHIAIVGRVKPHTGFAGSIESGLCKMMMIGLGKHKGAKTYHTALVTHSWEPFIRSVATEILAKLPICFGLGIVENAYDETAKIEATHPNQLIATDERLLKLASDWMPKLPFESADLLVIDQIGKEISGAGLDTNVVGLKPVAGKPRSPGIRRIFVRELSEHTHGNATGLGFADFTTDRLIEQMNYNATVVNCMTASHPEGAKIPIHFPSDREALESALLTVGLEDPSQATVMYIRDTLTVDELCVSANYDTTTSLNPLSDIQSCPFTFDSKGNMVSPFEK